MSLTPSALRLDLKCGKGAISQGKKCHKGAATAATNPNNTGLAAGRVIVATAAGGTIIGAILSRKQWTPTVEKAFKEAVAVLGNRPTLPAGSKFLSKGYAGAIYKAKDGKSVFKVNFKRTVDGRRQFEQELATQTQLRAKGINTPNVLAVDRKRSIAQIEFLDGYKNLTDIAKEGSSSEKKLYAKQFLIEMSKLHKAGYSHSDMHLGNVMVKDGDVQLIDWGYAVPLKNAPRSGMRNDMQHIEYMLDKLDKEEHSRFKALLNQTGLKKQVPSRDLYARFWDQLLSPNRTDTAFMTLTPSTLRLDLKCGKGSISKGEKCHKGPALSAGQIAGAAALTLGAGALTAYAMTRGKKARSGATPSPNPSGSPSPRPSAPRGPARLTGTPEPYGLLPPGRRPKSKTQRMRENTTAAMRQAEGAIGQTAREEVRRIGQIGNTMASVGEATGMATKTAFREVRLRTEAARRRFEPGYRRSPATAPQPPAQLAPGNDPALELPFNPQSTRPPEAVPIDPRTGQPRRRRARGFGPRRDGGMVSFSHPVYVDPAR